MLVLARKKTEVIRIGTDVVIKVLHVRNGIVRIGIDAPDTVRVLRGELFEAPSPHDPQTESAGEEFQSPAAGAAPSAAPSVAPLSQALREFRDRPAADLAPSLRIKPSSRN